MYSARRPLVALAASMQLPRSKSGCVVGIAKRAEGLRESYCEASTHKIVIWQVVLRKLIGMQGTGSMT